MHARTKLAVMGALAVAALAFLSLFRAQTQGSLRESKSGGIMKAGMKDASDRSGADGGAARVGDPFTVTTYNILATHYEKQMDAAHPTWLKWKYRKHRIMKALAPKSDVICLNEVTLAMLRDLNALGLDKTHDSTLPSAPHAGTSPGGGVRSTPRAGWGVDVRVFRKIGADDGTAILFRRSRFEKVGPALHGQLLPNYSHVFNAHTLRDKRAPGKTLSVLAMHLKAGLGKFEALRKQQFDEAMRVGGGALSNADGVVVCGDLNSDNNAAQQAGKFAYEPLVAAHAVTHYGFTNAAATKGKDHRITFNNPTDSFAASVFDYILVKGGVHVDAVHVPPAGKSAAPNKKHGSDHLPVTATLSWRRGGGEG